MATATEQRQTQRRRRDEAREAVIAAALELASSSSFKDLTVDEIAREAGVSRTAFYVHFRDKSELLLAAVEDVSSILYEEADRWWHGEGEPAELVRSAIAGIASVYAEHASLMRIATEVSTYDEEVREFWTGLVGRFIAATAAHIRLEQKAGRIRDSLGADTTADSLTWMTERCAYIHLGRGGEAPEALTEALSSIWVAALYG